MILWKKWQQRLLRASRLSLLTTIKNCPMGGSLTRGLSIEMPTMYSLRQVFAIVCSFLAFSSMFTKKHFDYLLCLYLFANIISCAWKEKIVFSVSLSPFFIQKKDFYIWINFEANLFEVFVSGSFPPYIRWYLTYFYSV